MAIIIVDPGKNQTKALYISKEYDLKVLLFPSKTDKVVTFNGREYSVGKNQFAVETKINDKNVRYIVGEGIKKDYDFRSTKNNDHHLICILTAVQVLLEQNHVKDEKINLIIGCPSDDYKNAKFIESYRKMIPKEISVSVNNKNRLLEFEDVHIYAEGISIKTRTINKALHPEAEIIVCIDIGGYNVNVRIYDKYGNTINSFSLDKAGVNVLMTYLKDGLSEVIDKTKYHFESINFMEVIEMGKIPNIKDEDFDGLESSEEFVSLYIEKFVEDNILAPLMRKGDINLAANGYLTLFSGGGSLLLEKYLNPYMQNNSFNVIFSDCSVWENGIAYAAKYIKDRQQERKDMTDLERNVIISKIINTKINDTDDKQPDIVS